MFDYNVSGLGKFIAYYREKIGKPVESFDDPELLKIVELGGTHPKSVIDRFVKQMGLTEEQFALELQEYGKHLFLRPN